MRAAYDYNNALLLYWYGYWPQAEARFTRIYEERCSGPEADATGQIAWENLRAMAMATEDSEEIRRLATDIQERGCTFSARPTRSTARGQPIATSRSAVRAPTSTRSCTRTRSRSTSRPARPPAATTAPLRAVRHDVARGGQQQSRTTGRRPSRSSTLRSRSRRPTGSSQQGSSTSASSTKSAPAKAEDAEEQQSLDAILANAHFKLAYTASRNFDFDRAVENYRVLADSPRFAKSADPQVQSKRADGLVNSAILLEQLQRYPEATQYYRRVYRQRQRRRDEAKRALPNRRDGLQTAALSRRRSAACVSSSRSTARDGEAGELVVRAHWRIAQSWKARGR